MKTCNPNCKYESTKCYWNILILYFSEGICYGPSKKSTRVMCNPEAAEYRADRPLVPVARAQGEDYLR